MLEEICIKYDNEIKEILEALEWGFYDELDQYSFEDDIISSFDEHYHKKYGWDNGATKGVLIFKDFGFVIKIPFMYCDGDELCGADEGNSGWDYCSQEANRYIVAKQNGLQNIFLETAFLKMVDGHPIYIQAFAEPLDKVYIAEKRSSTKEDEKIVTMMNEENNYCWIHSGWEADIFALYGGKYYKKFKNFIKDNRIQDLRDANIGYVGLKPVILDYAGFDD